MPIRFTSRAGMVRWPYADGRCLEAGSTLITAVADATAITRDTAAQFSLARA